jgi:hypothetical protein
MDALDPMTAAGVPCAFASYEIMSGEDWVTVRGGIPRRSERLRCV